MWILWIIINEKTIPNVLWIIIAYWHWYVVDSNMVWVISVEIPYKT